MDVLASFLDRTAHRDRPSVARPERVAAGLAAIAADEGFASLEGPIRHVTAPHTPASFSPPLEDAYLPLPGRIVAEAKRLLGA